jgi:putative mycofactocin binding protein MftB
VIALDRCYGLSRQAAIRPERFGGLIYRYDNRRLYFLHSAELVDFVNTLDGSVPLGLALDDFLASRQLPQNARTVFINALSQLKKMEVLDEL